MIVCNVANFHQWSCGFWKVATFQNLCFFAINTCEILRLITCEFFWTSSCSSAQIHLFVFFTTVEWLVVTIFLSINKLVNRIMLFWEDIFQFKPRILKENNFLKWTLCIQCARVSFLSVTNDYYRFWYVLRSLVFVI